jgi:hypothetical protein
MHGIGSASLQVRASFREFLRLHMQLPCRTPIIHAKNAYGRWGGQETARRRRRQ